MLQELDRLTEIRAFVNTRKEPFHDVAGP
jgi:hypothetical protein